MLDQAALAYDVQCLHAPADGEEGQVRVDRGAQERELEAVAVGLRRAGLLVRVLPVQ